MSHQQDEANLIEVPWTRIRHVFVTEAATVHHELCKRQHQAMCRSHRVRDSLEVSSHPPGTPKVCVSKHYKVHKTTHRAPIETRVPVAVGSAVVEEREQAAVIVVALARFCALCNT